MSAVAQFPSQDPILRFSISPDTHGRWLWDVRGQDGARLAGGLAASRKIAAALVIKQIVQARPLSAATPSPNAKAA